MVYKPSKERLIIARKRRLQREKKGSNLEYLECITDEYKMVSKIKELNNKGVSTLLSPERFNSMSSKTRNKMIELMEKFAEEDE